MARRRSLEDKLARLSELAIVGDSPNIHDELRRSLTDKSHHVVAKAAGIIGELGLADLAADVEAAFDRFFDDPMKTDRGCIAKTAIIQCLSRLELGTPDAYLRGLNHIQLEPSFGKPVDTAVELRAESALGLAASGYPDTVNELVGALTDVESPVRLAAVRALSATGRSEVESLLRFKASIGDDDPQVLSDTLEALLLLAPRRSLPLVETFLDSSDDAAAEAAALALGASRCEGAFEALTSRIDEGFDTAVTRTLLLALSMLRREESLAYLLEQVTKSRKRRAENAVRALAIHRYDPKLRERVEKAVAAREDPEELAALLEQEYGRQ